jgi:hypothetical protein
MNDFTQDPSCLVLWRFEPGALGSDSIGLHELYPFLAGLSDPVDFWEGTGSIKSTVASPGWYGIEDQYLVAGFPLKAGGGSVGTFCLYYKPIDESFANTILAKWDKCSLRVIEDTGALKVWWGYSDTEYEEGVPNEVDPPLFQTNNAYHLGIKLDGPNKRVTIRARNLSTGEVATYTYDFTNAINIADAIFEIGATTNDSPGTMRGNLDELVVFNRLLSDAEIDQIVAGTFGVPVYPFSPGLPLLTASRQPEINGGTALTAIGDQVDQAIFWELVAYDPITGREGAAMGTLMFQKTITDGAMHCKNYYFSPVNPALVGKIDRVKARIAHA